MTKSNTKSLTHKMSLDVLYPFKIDPNFEIGYAWCADLAFRLRSKLYLFTSQSSHDASFGARVFDAITNAQSFYVRHFHSTPSIWPMVTTDLEQGDFYSIIEKHQPGEKDKIIVLHSRWFTPDQLKSVIRSGHPVIVLPFIDTGNELFKKIYGPDLFIEIYRSAAFYNIKDSFFNQISQDKSLFSAITRVFKREISKVLTAQKKTLIKCDLA